MTDVTVYLIDPYLARCRPEILPADFIALVDEGLMLEAHRLNSTDVLYAVEHHDVQSYWKVPGLRRIFGPGCVLGRSPTGGVLAHPSIAIEQLAAIAGFGCLPEPIRLENGFHPWLRQHHEKSPCRTR
jgi:hypothetical protein